MPMPPPSDDHLHATDATDAHMPVSRRDPAFMLAWTEARCREGVGEACFCLWEPACRAAVLGLSQEAGRELECSALEAEGIAVLRRASGGGAVILSPGVLCFEVYMPVDAADPTPDIHGSFRAATAPVLAACRGLGVEAVQAGISDLAAVGGSEPGTLHKICGTAQLRKRGAVLVHGSLLVDVDTQAFGRFLRFPSEVPTYRAGRDHASFCRTLRAIRGRATSTGLVAEGVRAAMAGAGVGEVLVPEELCGLSQQLLEEKYRQASWNLHRQRPKGL